MDLEKDTLGNNNIEDVSWLCHLSKSELVSFFLIAFRPMKNFIESELVSQCMDLEEDNLGNNSIEDVSWLCHLSESELVSFFNCF